MEQFLKQNLNSKFEISVKEKSNSGSPFRR